MAKKDQTHKIGKQDKDFEKVGRKGSPINDRAKHFNIDRNNPTAYKGNDISWWNRAQWLFEQATKVPATMLPGMVYPMVLRHNEAREEAYAPGIARADFIPTIGAAKDGKDWVNKSFTQWYSKMASKKSGSLPFTQANLAMFTISMTSLAAGIAHARRALLCLDEWSSINQYLPRDLVTSMGFDYEDLRDNFPSYMARFGTLVHAFNIMTVPDISPIFTRQFALAHNLYRDEDSPYGQIFFFRPTGFWQFTDITNECEFIRYTYDADHATFGTYLDQLESGIDAWYNTDAFGMLKGNILAVAPEGMKFVYVPEITSSERVSINVDRNINYQFNNMIIIPDDNITVQPITEDVVANNLISKIGINNTWLNAFARSHLILNSYDGNVDSEFVMEATRLIPVIETPYASGELTWLNVFPTEIVTQLTTFVAGPDGTLIGNAFTSSIKTISDDSLDVIGLFQIMYSHNKLAKFRNAPRLYVNVTNGNTVLYHTESGDYFMPVPIDQYQLEQLHGAAIASLYYTE